MAKKITFTPNHKPDPFHFVLSTRGKKHLGEICNVDQSSIIYRTQMNGVNEITFTVYKELNKYIDPLWDKIQNLKLVYVPELDEYFEISFSMVETNSIEKRITAKSLCEAELGQTMLYNIEINTEDDIAREDYVITVLYNPENPKGSLLHRILEKTPHYSIKHVDDTIAKLQRSFSIDNTSIYDFLTNTCAEQFNCLFQFDSTDRSISVYDLYTVCMNDECSYYLENNKRYRGDFNNICPICGGRDLYYYGNDTTILVDKDNLTDQIDFETNVDQIKNTFRLEAGDDDMTAAIINNNQNGSAYLYYFSDEAKEDMSPELVAKMNEYDALYESYEDEYQLLTKNTYDSIDRLLYLRSTMMPSHEPIETTAAQEVAKLNSENMSPLGLSNVSSHTSISTVNSALKNYAKVYIYSGRYSVSIQEGTFTYVGEDEQGYKYGTWVGKFYVENYSDEEDNAISEEDITIKVYNKYDDFLNQKILKQIAKDNKKVDDNSIYDVLGIQDLDAFKEALTYYCLNRLTSFFDAIQSCLDILVQVDQASEGAEYYDDIYTPYYNKLAACQDEIDVRSSQIDVETANYESLISRRKEIQKTLNFRDYIGESLYSEFCSYRREDTYSNSNYISDGLSNTDIFTNANQFLNMAKREIKIAGTPQHTISSNLYNLLMMDEFQPIVDYYELGNFIRLMVDGEVYRLRLSEYEINFSGLNNLSTKFTDLTKDISTIELMKHAISSAQQMATSYSYVAKQAESGQEAKNTISEMQKTGLNSSLFKIKNADTEEVVIDNHGIVGRAYDDITNSYEVEQVKITHNALAFTNDNWETVKLAIGKHSYNLDGTTYEEYGMSADFVIAGKMIGGDIYSTNYSSGTVKAGTHINLDNGNFSFAGERLKYDGNNLSITGVINATGGTFTGDITVLGTITGGSFSNVTISNSTFSGLSFEGSSFINPSITGGNIRGTTIINPTISTMINPSDSSTRNTYTGKIVKDVTQSSNGTITCTYLDVIDGIIVEDKT